MVNTEVRKIVLAVFSIFGAVIFLLAMSCNVFADDIAPVTASSKFSVDVNNAVLELTIPSTPAVIDLNPTMTGASFGSTSIDIKVATNNITGYTLTMTPTNNTEATSLIRTELVGDEQNYREIETLELTDPISTGYTEQTFTANKWGYKITGDNYYGIDPENTTVSHPAWVTDAPTNETHHNLTLAAKVDADTVSGAYETTLNFRAVTNALVAKDTIKFDKNNENATGAAMDDVTATVGQTITLPQNQFSLTGMKFVGWSTVASGTGGYVYADQASYTPVDIGYSKIVTLYAQWAPSNTPTPSGSSGATGTTFTRAYEIAYTAMHKGMYEEQHEGQGDYALVNSWPPDSESYSGFDVRFAMQDMTPEICASVTVMHDDYQALDTRDNKLYHITKLKDGRCWMTQNLDFSIATGTNGKGAPLTSEETDLNVYGVNNYTSQYGYSQDANTGIITWTPYRPTIDGSSGSFYFNRDYFTSVSMDVGDYYQDDTYFAKGNCNFFDSGCQHFRISTPYPNNDTHGHVGNYYNFPAAIANDGVYENGFVNTTSDPATTPQNSICPKGWRLPMAITNGDDNTYNEVYALSWSYRNDYSDSDRFWFGAPFYYTRTGDAFSDSLEFVGDSGFYWTSTIPNRPVNMEGNVGTGYSQYTEHGDTIRCVAR